MEVLGTSSISGDNIGFYFVGNGADLFLYDQVDVQISGPVSEAYPVDSGSSTCCV
jgi:hypothetical protein